MNLIRKPLAEFIGTFALTFVGISAITVNAGLVGVALAHGLTLVVMITAYGYISGGHFNPAVTIGAFSGKKISFNEAIGYIIAQLLGGLVAALAVKSFYPADLVNAVSLGTPMPAPNVDITAVIGMEIVATFFLMTAVFNTAIDSRAPRMGGLFIGLTVTLDILAFGPLTGASMNPARSFGPALVGGYWDAHIVYWIGPIVGAIIAAFVYTSIFEKKG